MIARLLIDTKIMVQIDRHTDRQGRHRDIEAYRQAGIET